MNKRIERTVKASKIDFRLSTDDLIELAGTGKVKNIVLDDMAKIVLHECLYMLNFEKKYYERERKREQKKQKA